MRGTTPGQEHGLYTGGDEKPQEGFEQEPWQLRGKRIEGEQETRWRFVAKAQEVDQAAGMKAKP